MSAQNIVGPCYTVESLAFDRLRRCSIRANEGHASFLLDDSHSCCLDPVRTATMVMFPLLLNRVTKGMFSSVITSYPLRRVGDTKMISGWDAMMSAGSRASVHSYHLHPSVSTSGQAIPYSASGGWYWSLPLCL